MQGKKRAAIVFTLVFAAASTFTSFAAGWTGTPQGVKYQWGSGDFCENNWVLYRNHWYYFGSDQLLRTGWIQRDNTWYFATDTGELQGGLMKINGNVYYFDSNSCKMRTGDRNVRGTTYHFTENGTTNGAPYIYEEWNSDGSKRRGEKIKVR